MAFHTLLVCLAFVNLSIAGYVLEDDYTPSKFFDMFSFWTTSDPTHGFVQYVDRATAQNSGLISSTSSSVYMGVDHTNVTPNGRPSVRLTSTKSYDSGLIILDLAHMPGGICGTWPAFWTLGPDWPNNGEIDIIEGVNEQSTNAMTLHTGQGCTITNNNKFSGTLSTSNCDVNAAGQPANAGCSIVAKNSNTYGTGFNAIQGGVYATEWTGSVISVYFFPRGSIPSDISRGSPDPSGWGTPLAQFQGGCDISKKFKSQQIVFDTTFCGDWAGAVWSGSSCASKANTCNDYVQNNPSAFTDAYWSVNSLRVYRAVAGTSSSSASSSSLAASSSVLTAVSTSSSTSTSRVTSSSSTTSSASTSKSSSATPTTTTTTATTATSSSTTSTTTTSSRSRRHTRTYAKKAVPTIHSTTISTTTVPHGSFAPSSRIPLHAGNATDAFAPTGSGVSRASLEIGAHAIGTAPHALPSTHSTGLSSKAPTFNHVADETRIAASVSKPTDVSHPEETSLLPSSRTSEPPTEKPTSGPYQPEGTDRRLPWNWLSSHAEHAHTEHGNAGSPKNWPHSRRARHLGAHKKRHGGLVG
ncbi:hypothetical protein LTR66_008638 [Elasticomyces elasticus]|nr:hypothetical protein LTR66_008638 [Elasticomyces elasticus]